MIQKKGLNKLDAIRRQKTIEMFIPLNNFFLKSNLTNAEQMELMKIVNGITQAVIEMCFEGTEKAVDAWFEKIKP